ncbi:MAG: class I SAM-dependent methyltransferase [Bacteroidota bacterium]|jgi:SAM-dependent methyltransferase
MAAKANDEWFSTWFDSPYYHILYGHRDDSDAQHFIDQLTSLPWFKSASKVADVCCGKGRHSYYLHSKGFEVTGYDLSPASIQHCLESTKPGLEFRVHDMRNPYSDMDFDVVLNLFTSFGYFETGSDNQKAISNMAEALKPSGRLVIDFLNAQLVAKQLVPHESISRNGIQFEITRRICDGRLIKEILFEVHGKQNRFEENVELIQLSEFSTYMSNAGMTIEQVYGNYDLHPYNAAESPRMIIIAKHNQA